MQAFTLAGLLLALAAAPQEKATPKADQAAAGPPATLAGCISTKPDEKGRYTISDRDGKVRYQLTGTSVREYAGRHVELTSEKPSALTIRGGLVPSPNVAAQAGHLDAAAAALANQPGVKTPAASRLPLPEFRVETVRSIGTCP